MKYTKTDTVFKEKRNNSKNRIKLATHKAWEQYFYFNIAYSHTASPI